MLFLCKLALDGWLLGVELLDLLVLEPGSGLDIIELVRHFTCPIISIIQLNLLLLKILRHLLYPLLILVVNFSDFLHLLRLFEFLSLRDDLLLGLLKHNLALGIFLLKFLTQLLVHLLGQIALDLLVMVLNRRLQLLFILLLDRCLLLGQLLFKLLFHVLLELLVFLHKFLLKGLFLGVEALLLLFADLGKERLVECFLLFLHNFFILFLHFSISLSNFLLFLHFNHVFFII